MTNFTHRSFSLQTNISEADGLLLKSDVVAGMGEYLLAVLLLYRALDVATHDLISKNNPFSNWSTGVFSAIKEVFLDIRQSIHANRNLPIRLGFSDSLIVLHILYPKIITFLLLKEILALAELRHNTWITHGKDVPLKTDYLHMKKVYKSVINQLLPEIKNSVNRNKR